MKMFRKLLSAMMAATLLTTSVNLGVFAENSASDDSPKIPRRTIRWKFIRLRA